MVGTSPLTSFTTSTTLYNPFTPLASRHSSDVCSHSLEYVKNVYWWALLRFNPGWLLFELRLDWGLDWPVGQLADGLVSYVRRRYRGASASAIGDCVQRVQRV